MKPIALITGASGGIGAAIAQRFAQNGYAVVLQYHHNRERALSAASAFPDDTPFLCVACDLCDEASVQRLVEEVHERLGTVSVLINCAGVALPQKLFSDTTDSDYDHVFDVNVRATMRVTRALLDDLRSCENAAVVNLSSMWGVCGASCEVLYSATKAAVIGFTKALAKELAPAGVRVNCVAPGLVMTAMNSHLSETDLTAFCSEVPLGRPGTPDEIADAVLYLTKARYTTGQVLCCDGGITI